MKNSCELPQCYPVSFDSYETSNSSSLNMLENFEGTNVVTLYKQPNYQGIGVPITKDGDYPYNSGVIQSQIGNDSLNSLTVPPGVTVTLWGNDIGSGTSLAVTSNIPDLSKVGDAQDAGWRWNNQMSSFSVKGLNAINSPPPPPPPSPPTQPMPTQPMPTQPMLTQPIPSQSMPSQSMPSLSMPTQPQAQALPTQPQALVKPLSVGPALSGGPSTLIPGVPDMYVYIGGGVLVLLIILMAR